MDEILRLCGLFNEGDESAEMETFAQKRHDGAEKIAMAAKEKGGPALLTYHHFKVKLPYYKKAAKGSFDYNEYKKEYKKLCSELHSHMKSIENMNQTKFQELVGKLEVVGELLIKSQSK
jgi:uncharacterized protein YabN with tetrapyrrole methylase and pyrophosphatase domain